MIKNHTKKPIACVGYDAGGNVTTSTYTISEGDIRYSPTYVLHRRVTRLDFGPLSFNLEIEHFNYAAFIKLRNKYLHVDEQSLPIQVINPFTLLDNTTQLHPEEVAIVAEVSGSLSGGISLITGKPYVIKHSIIKPNHSGCQMEYDLMSTFSKEQPLQLLPTVCKPTQQPQEYRTATYTMDMALFSLHSYFTKYPAAMTNSEFFHYAQDIFIGLHILHSKGTVHGNINPHTLLLLSYPEALPAKTSLKMHAAICPIVKSAPRDTDQNRPFVAPCPKGGKQYSKEADIWALGATWLWCLDIYDSVSADPKHRSLNTMVKLNDTLTQSQCELTRKFLTMVKRMVVSDPSRRPTTQDLLQSTLWVMMRDNPSMPMLRYRKRRAEGDIPDRKRRHMSV